jgi:hypothetical protein
VDSSGWTSRASVRTEAALAGTLGRCGLDQRLRPDWQPHAARRCEASGTRTLPAVRVVAGFFQCDVTREGHRPGPLQELGRLGDDVVVPAGAFLVLEQHEVAVVVEAGIGAGRGAA